VEPASFGAEVILVKPVAAGRLLDAVGRCFRATPPDSALTTPTPSPVAPGDEPRS
jgi:hypothetical protein